MKGGVRLAGNLIPTSQALVAEYERRIILYGYTAEAMFYRTGKQHIDKLEAYSEMIGGISEIRSQNVLDLGCGFGALIPFLPKVASYLGVDIVPGFIQEALRCFPDYRFDVGDGANLPERTFDICILAGVISGVPNPEGLLTQAFSLANSRVIFDATMADRIPKDFQGLNRFTVGRVEEIIASNGFYIEDTLDIGHSWLLFKSRRR